MEPTELEVVTRIVESDLWFTKASAAVVSIKTHLAAKGSNCAVSVVDADRFVKRGEDLMVDQPWIVDLRRTDGTTPLPMCMCACVCAFVLPTPSLCWGSVSRRTC